MTTSNDNRQQLIQRVMAKTTGETAEISVKLWQQLASQLTSIIGRGGFNALFARSLHITQSTYPWILSGRDTQNPDLQFAKLKIDLGKQNAAEACQANITLLTTFTDILASLIGESLTFDLINSAWGDNAQEMEKPGEGF